MKTLLFVSLPLDELISSLLSNLHCTCGITPKRVTSGGIHLRVWTTQLRRNIAAVANTESNLTDRESNPRPPAPIAIYANCPVPMHLPPRCQYFQWELELLYVRSFQLAAVCVQLIVMEFRWPSVTPLRSVPPIEAALVRGEHTGMLG